MNGPQSNWGQPIAYHPLLAKFFGSVNAGIFFGQLAYWEPRAGVSRALGVYKSSQQWTDETGLSYREQVTARRILVDAGYMAEEHRRLEHRIYFRIEWANFNADFGPWVESRGGAFAPDSANDENAIGRATDTHAPNDENAIRGVQKRRSSIDTETTAETTAESSAAAGAPAPAKKPSRARIAKPSFPCPEGVDAGAWTDFLAVRKAKRAPMTQTALDGIVREAAKVGLSLDEAVRVCCQRNWQGFRADWWQEQQPARAGRPGAVVDVQARNAAAKRMLGFGERE